MRLFCILCLFLILGSAGSAQTVIYGPGPDRAFQNPYTGPQTIVRDSKANLYVIYRYRVSSIRWDIAIGKSTNGGSSWDLNWQKGFAGNPAGDFGNYHPCMAIDSQDNLHCAWNHRVAVTGSRIPQTLRYNRYEAATQMWGTEWVVTPTAKFELNNCCLAVDQNDYVWFTHGANSYSWHSYLERSDKPFASDGKFTRYSPYYVSSGYSQHNCLCVDALGQLHFTYYGLYGGNYGIFHQWIDPGAATPKWSTQVTLSYPPGHNLRADYSSKMAADNAGNVYVIYPVDSQYPSSHNTRDTDFWVRKWDGSTQTWGNAVLVHQVPNAVWAANKGSSSYAVDRIISCACDENTGELYIIYRDFTSGQFVLGRWRGDDTEPPTVYAELMGVSPPGPPNYFLYPRMRGSLWPPTNRTAWGLDIMYVVGDQSTTKSYTDYFEHFPVASMNSVGAPKIGTSYPLDLGGVAEGGKAYVTALTTSGLMSMIQIGKRYIPLVPDPMFYTTVLNKIPSVFQNFQGILNASGSGQAMVAIPNLSVLVGVKIDGCFVTLDTGGFHAISNPWGFTITN